MRWQILLTTTVFLAGAGGLRAVDRKGGDRDLHPLRPAVRTLVRRRRLVARAKSVPRAKLRQQYEDQFMAALAHLRDQVYLNPHPKELALRNHV